MPSRVQRSLHIFKERVQLLWLHRQYDHVRVTNGRRIVRPDGMTRLGQVFELGRNAPGERDFSSREQSSTHPTGRQRPPQIADSEDRDPRPVAHNNRLSFMLVAIGYALGPPNGEGVASIDVAYPRFSSQYR